MRKNLFFREILILNLLGFYINSFFKEYYSCMNDNTYNFCQQAHINPENDDENINEFSNLFLESYKQYDESSIQGDYIIGINIFF